MLRQASNKRFEFLKPSSPYHAWYLAKVQEVKDSAGVQPDGDVDEDTAETV